MEEDKSFVSIFGVALVERELWGCWRHWDLYRRVACHSVKLGCCDVRRDVSGRRKRDSVTRDELARIVSSICFPKSVVICRSCNNRVEPSALVCLLVYVSTRSACIGGIASCVYRRWVSSSCNGRTRVGRYILSLFYDAVSLSCDGSSKWRKELRVMCNDLVTLWSPKFVGIATMLQAAGFGVRIPIGEGFFFFKFGTHLISCLVGVVFISEGGG